MPVTAELKKMSGKENAKLEKKWEEERKLRNTAWQDLSVEQKLERVREKIKSVQQNLGYRLPRIDEGIRNLEKHQHSGDENIVVPLKGSSYGLGETAMDSEKRPEGKELF